MVLPTELSWRSCIYFVPYWAVHCHTHTPWRGDTPLGSLPLPCVFLYCWCYQAWKNQHEGYFTLAVCVISFNAWCTKRETQPWSKRSFTSSLYLNSGPVHAAESQCLWFTLSPCGAYRIIWSCFTSFVWVRNFQTEIILWEHIGWVHFPLPGQFR